jgi:hypothetical protein
MSAGSLAAGWLYGPYCLHSVWPREEPRSQGYLAKAVKASKDATLAAENAEESVKTAREQADGKSQT